MRRIEIVPASGGLAVVETYIGAKRTAMSAPQPLAVARLWGEQAEDEGLQVIDHTHEGRDAAGVRRRALDRMASGAFRP